MIRIEDYDLFAKCHCGHENLVDWDHHKEPTECSWVCEACEEELDYLAPAHPVFESNLRDELLYMVVEPFIEEKRLDDVDRARAVSSLGF